MATGSNKMDNSFDWGIEDEISSEEDDDEDDSDDDAAAMYNEILNLGINRDDPNLDMYDVELGNLILLDPDLLQDRPSSSKKPDKPIYACGAEVKDECAICCDSCSLRRRLCCDLAVCDACMNTYLIGKVEEGSVKISCLNDRCESFVHRDEIIGRLPIEMKDKFYKFLVNANKDPYIKTCPQCSHVLHVDKTVVLSHKEKTGLLVTCMVCHFDWCFRCHAPWHDTITCHEYQKGDRLLISWSKEFHYGNKNAQRCPKCKIFIERKAGCDHMICSRCCTNFCYRCGERYFRLKFFGQHSSSLSPFGCKYNFQPNRPGVRRLVRGSVLGAKVILGVGLLGIGIAAGALLVGASVVILPAYAGYKYHKHRRRKMWKKRRQMLFKMRNTTAMMEALREQAVTERLRSKMTEQSTEEDFLRLGIQTQDSQKVEVLVHYPEQDGASPDQTINSEIRMDVRNDSGRVTVTTAEISQGTGEGSEVILHVKTSYSKDEESEAEDLMSSNHVSRKSSTVKNGSVDSTNENVGKNEGSNTSPSPVVQRRESKKGPDVANTSADDNDTDVSETVPDSGCFLKLLTKRLNSLQNGTDKEKLGERLSSNSKSEPGKVDDVDLIRDYTSDCPDIVTSAIESELRHAWDRIPDEFPYFTEARLEPQDVLSVQSNTLPFPQTASTKKFDPYAGLIAAESCETPL